MTVEKAKESLPKLPVHKAVRDGITATGNISQQLYQADARTSNRGVHEIWREKIPRIDHVQRCPTDEKFQHDDKQHPDHLKIKRQRFSH